MDKELSEEIENLKPETVMDLVEKILNDFDHTYLLLKKLFAHEKYKECDHRIVYGLICNCLSYYHLEKQKINNLNKRTLDRYYVSHPMGDKHIDLARYIRYKCEKEALALLDTEFERDTLYVEPLILACRLNRKIIALKILEDEDFDVNDIDSKDKTALEHAINNNMEEVAIKIINHKTFDSIRHRRALRYAICKRLTKVCELLLEHSSTPCTIYDFERALIHKLNDIAMKIINHSTYDITSFGHYKYNSVMLSINYEAWEICIHILKTKQFDINHTHSYGKNLLIMIIVYSNNIYYRNSKLTYPEKKVIEELNETYRFEIYSLIISDPKLNINYIDENETAYTLLNTEFNGGYRAPFKYHELMLKREDINLHLQLNKINTVFSESAIYFASRFDRVNRGIKIDNFGPEYVDLLFEHPNLYKNIDKILDTEYHTYHICDLPEKYRKIFNSLYGKNKLQNVPE